LSEFEIKNHRRFDDTDARIAEFEENFPDFETWRLTHDQHASMYVSDLRQMAYFLAHKFDGENNPRTPEYVRRVSEGYSQLAQKAHDSFNDGVFEAELPHDYLQMGVGPSAADRDRQLQDFIQDYGKDWAEMDESDFHSQPSAVLAALKYVPGYIEASRIAR